MKEEPSIEELIAAINKEEMSFHIQSIVNSRGIIIGGECLLRWNHNKLGLIMPEKILNLAKKNGLSRKIGILTLEKSFAMSEAASCLNRNLYLSFNFEIDDLLNEDFYKQFVNYIISKKHQTPIIYEILENTEIKNYGLVEDTLLKYSKNGIEFFLDDFGSGYSSLLHLSRLKVNSIKIDKQLISEIESNEKQRNIIFLLMNLSKILDVNVIIEGVERESQLKCLKKIGAFNYQGYFFGKPKPFSEWLFEVKNQDLCQSI